MNLFAYTFYATILFIGTVILAIFAPTVAMTVWLLTFTILIMFIGVVMVVTFSCLGYWALKTWWERIRNGY